MRNVVEKSQWRSCCCYPFREIFLPPNRVIKGSTTVCPCGASTLEAFVKKNPDLQISLSGGGSGEGIKMIDKTTDIATSSREIKKKKFLWLKAKASNR